MRAADLATRRVAVWGLGREGRAAIAFLKRRHPNLPLLVLDDAADGSAPAGLGDGLEYAFGPDRIARALDNIEIVVKSPGVSLYRREIQSARAKGMQVTSLLNLWFGEGPDITTICVTGTKGKSTTASLIAHIAARFGRRVALVGNIGRPITCIDPASADIAVIEVSSYQAADFDGQCDIAVLTSLYPEHIDWHLSVDNYFRDKINLLKRSRCCVAQRATAEILRRLMAGPSRQEFFDDEAGVHCRGIEMLDARRVIGNVLDPYLRRPHNLSNLCAAMTVAKSLGLDPVAALAAASGFHALPHRQQELGEIEGVLFVDDSISTIPESTAAALAVYAGREITLILGGHDRGIDYDGLVKNLIAGAAKTVICLGDSGARIYSLARRRADQQGDIPCNIKRAQSMADAVAYARRVTPPGGVVLLSPAAPSFGPYRDYIERGRDFAAKAGLPEPEEMDSYSAAE
ncbi:MAG: UDP-N-acetylmuramoyl-L-alanine--D-glutamate ligase [Alphaproteobacteria bacterium]|nr:UDP-N-acetylmuramoyl-L-alanine--D-glutamate ligase [Alphaproteobacteria bacterium]MBV9816146.1 UDP-N-acetylmuramoyl-L-alanine--D-glutamate ligase [Alphaproteobacteria bacterium]